MAFPGGHHEQSDPDLLQTAIRETREEVGLDLENDEFLGVLPEVQPVSRSRRLWIQPCVFSVASWRPLTPNPEVAAVHRFAFQRFLDGEGRGELTYNWAGTPVQLPCVRLDGTLIWGLTLQMIDTLVAQVER